MAEVHVGDLVKWQTTEKGKVGVVEAVNSDGTCTIDISEKGIRRKEKIRTDRLEVITSTIKPQAPCCGEAEAPGNPPTEAPFQES